MKSTVSRRASLGVLLAGLALLLSSHQADGQIPGEYNMPAFHLDAGRGTSTGGAWSVSGIVGQLEAGVLTSAGFALEGGFPVLDVIALPSLPPRLIIRQVDGKVVLSWPSSLAEYDLVQTSALENLRDDWTIAAGPKREDGGVISMTLPANGAQMFFRLKRR